MNSVATCDVTFDGSPVGRICINPAHNPYTVGTVNSDSGRGLVVKNVVTDSSASTNYYYNSLDTATATVESSIGQQFNTVINKALLDP